jgi:ubiquinone/menaquinone biosynthesis C-methylase UbiE
MKNHFNPVVYSKINDLQRNFAENLLKERLKLFEWKKDGSDSLLDIGCGSGDVTVDFLFPLLPENSRTLIGVDKSREMVKYCKEKYESGSLRFHQLDIEEKLFGGEINKDLQPGKFKYVTSFFTLHWIRNQRYELFEIE